MNFSDQELLQLVPQGDLRALSRLISLVENRSKRGRAVLSKLFGRGGKALVLGVTGSPGAGKSTLVDQIAKFWRKSGKRVAIIAIDPTSPFSGGAVLGDRIRMVSVAEDPDVYIRSMATRGALGGLSRATLEAVQVLDVAGYDLVIVETVGVGQAEVDIVRLADTCLVLLVPGMGDSVQAIKAGILEIADLFVINKSDRDGADALQRDIRLLLSLTTPEPGSWLPQIVRTVATNAIGIEELVQSCIEHQTWLMSSGQGQARRRLMMRDTILKLSQEISIDNLLLSKGRELEIGIEECLKRKTDPYSLAQSLTQPIS